MRRDESADDELSGHRVFFFCGDSFSEVSEETLSILQYLELSFLN